MAVVYNFVQTNPNSTGLKLATCEVVNGANTLEQQIVTLGDPSTAANQAGVVAKGTQGSFGLATQDLKDSGRTTVCFGGTVSIGTSETITPISVLKAGNAILTAQSSYTVTIGKTLRIQAAYFTATTSSPANTVFNIHAAVGAVTASSNVVLPFYLTTIASYTYIFSCPIPDGFEISGGTSIAFGCNAGYTGNANITYIGYEF